MSTSVKKILQLLKNLQEKNIQQGGIFYKQPVIELKVFPSIFIFIFLNVLLKYSYIFLKTQNYLRVLHPSQKSGKVTFGIILNENIVFVVWPRWLVQLGDLIIAIWLVTYVLMHFSR